MPRALEDHDVQATLQVVARRQPCTWDVVDKWVARHPQGSPYGYYILRWLVDHGHVEAVVVDEKGGPCHAGRPQVTLYRVT